MRTPTCPHLARPGAANPLPTADGLCRSLRLGGGGAVVTVGQEWSSWPPPQLIGLFPRREAYPPTQTPAPQDSKGHTRVGGVGGGVPTPFLSLLPQGGYLLAAMALSPQVLGPGVPLELCVGGSHPSCGVQKPLRSQNLAVWSGRALGERSESSSWTPGSARSDPAAR